MKGPNKELIRKALALVIEAEKTWRAAWGNRIPALRTDTQAVTSGLSTARDMLRNISQ
jgi:hypothetical protein